METFINTEFLGDTVQLRITYHEEMHNDYEPAYVVLDELATITTDGNGHELADDVSNWLLNPVMYKHIIGEMGKLKESV